MQTFRLRAKQIFLTYPQIKDATTVDNIINYLREQPTQYAICARELHQDGGLHLHCALLYPECLHISRADYFDNSGQHPNMQGVRNWRATVAYITKGGDWVDWGTNPGKKLTTSLIEHAAKDTPAHEAIREYLESKSASTRGYRSLIADYCAFRDDYRRRILEPDPNFSRFNACTIGTAITFRFKSEFKSPKLFIHGPPNVGKTTLLNQWDQRFIFNAPDNNDWSGFDSTFHRIIIFDEFHGQVQLSTLLKLMQGSITRLNTKGGSVDCIKNLPMLFLSNIHPKNCYRHSDAFIARLTIYYMPTFHSNIIFD